MEQDIQAYIDNMMREYARFGDEHFVEENGKVVASLKTHTVSIKDLSAHLTADGYAYRAKLFIDGVFIADVGNAGMGGEANFLSRPTNPALVAETDDELCQLSPKINLHLPALCDMLADENVE